MISNSTLSMPAKIANGAETWKGFCGGSSYSIATYLQAFSCGFVQDTYSLTIDDVAYNQGGQLNTALMSVNNGKYANGGMILNPFAAMNDGLIDITWISDPSYSGTFGVTGIFSDARAGAGI
jgi:diacylglycerol kinase family enzyme